MRDYSGGHSTEATERPFLHTGKSDRPCLEQTGWIRVPGHQDRWSERDLVIEILVETAGIVARPPTRHAPFITLVIWW